jgi:NADH dehydrogenase FAD-containing subunit
MKDMKNFIKDVKDKPIQQTKKVRKGQFATIEEARQAAKNAGKKTFNFGGKKNIPVKKVREVNFLK